MTAVLAQVVPHGMWLLACILLVVLVLALVQMLFPELSGDEAGSAPAGQGRKGAGK